MNLLPLKWEQLIKMKWIGIILYFGLQIYCVSKETIKVLLKYLLIY